MKGLVNRSLKCEAQVGILKGFNPLSGGLEAAPPTHPPYCKNADEEETSEAMFPMSQKKRLVAYTA